MAENLQEAKEMVRNNEPSINELIKPKDLIHQDVENWENVDRERLKDELCGSMGESWTYGINHPYGDTIRELAVSRFVDDMQRVPMEDLNPERYQGIEDMAVNGYWPNSVSRQKIENVVYEWKDDISFFHEYEDEIRMEIKSAILNARLDF